MSVDVRPLERDPRGHVLNWGTQLASFTKSVTEAGVTLTCAVDTKEVLIVPPAATTAWSIKGTSGATGEAWVSLVGPLPMSLAVVAGETICEMKTASGVGTVTFGILVAR